MTSDFPALEALHFGAEDRRLFGMLHRPGKPAPERAAVLLCNAFGQEAIRAHRMMRVLAERLCKQGHTVLRFDYYGTGDSMGDDLQADLHGWQQDVLSADEELVRQSRASRTLWIGMRLGGTAVLRALESGPTHLAGAIAWDPVLDGRQYLAFLRDRHVASLEDAFSVMSRPTPRELAADPANFADEAIGFALSHAMRTQLSALSPASWKWPATHARVWVISDDGTPDGQDVARAWPSSNGSMQRIQLKHDTDWTTDAADNSALVPAPALFKLTQLAGELG